jgi:hypothetical protein
MPLIENYAEILIANGWNYKIVDGTIVIRIAP